MILSINSVPYGSTAKIMTGIAELCTLSGIKNVTSTGYSYHPIKELLIDNIKIGNFFDKLIHMILCRFTGYHGYFSRITTKFFLKKVSKINPNIIHLHNIHGWFINYDILFNYIKKNKIRVIWTLHDCWTFTGQCPYFTMEKCDKWKTGCHNCSQLKLYPKTYVDRSNVMWRKKREWFTGIEKMTIVTPSQWLADLVKESFLKDYPVRVINNGIDLSVFKPTESDFRRKYAIGNKYILLGVAFGWEKRKGLDVFIELSKRLDSGKYQIVLVGTDNKVDKLLPENILSIHRTQNQQELAEIYTAADLFVNATREDNYPTVNMEAIACGTPVLTFRTGGSPEMLDETCGSVVECDDVDALETEIKRITKKNVFSVDICTKKAREFDQMEKYEEYVTLYRQEIDLEEDQDG